MAAMMMRAKAPLALRATTTVSSRRAVSLVARAAEQEPAAPAAAPATPVAEEPLNGVSVQQMQPIPVAAAPSGTVAAPSFFGESCCYVCWEPVETWRRALHSSQPATQTAYVVWGDRVCRHPVSLKSSPVCFNLSALTAASFACAPLPPPSTTHRNHNRGHVLLQPHRP